MQSMNFMLTLATEPDLNTTDRLYGYFGEDGAAPDSVLDFTLVIQSGHRLRTALWKLYRLRQHLNRCCQNCVRRSSGRARGGR